MLKGTVRGALAVVILAAMLSPALAVPPIIEEAKDACVVGERNDGYLGVIDEAEASDALRREVADINQRRKREYARVAVQSGASIDNAAIIAAQELINRAPAGHCVQDAKGSWIKR